MPSTECARDDARSMSVCYQELHRYKYQVLRPYRHRTRICGFTFESDYLKLDADGTLEVRKTYAWDGPSGPAPDVPCLMRASLVHDALYQLIRERAIPFELRDLADRLLQGIAREDGLPRPLAAAAYWAVRLFGRSCARPGSEKETLLICVP